MNEDTLKRAIDKIDVQVEATIQVLAGGRQINGNAFDMNNLLIIFRLLPGFPQLFLDLQIL